MKRILMLCLCVAAASCASDPAKFDQVAGRDRDKDAKECDFEASKAVGGKPGLIRRPVLVDECMSLRGYGRK